MYSMKYTLNEQYPYCVHFFINIDYYLVSSLCGNVLEVTLVKFNIAVEFENAPLIEGTLTPVWSYPMDALLWVRHIEEGST